MAEYIDREKIFYEFISRYKLSDTASQTLEMLHGIIRELPAADVEPVIRCKDCAKWVPAGENSESCVCWELSDAVLGDYHYTPPDGYCHMAERRKDCPPWLQEIKEAMQDG